MKSSLQALSLLLLSLCSIATPAATVVECEDAAGERTFQTVCPPDATLVKSKDYATGTPDAGPVAAKPAISIYLVPKCAACDAYMKLFSRYGIAPTVKNIDGNRELQDELMKISGALKAPTVIIGDQKLSDYREQELTKLIEGLGYKPVKAGKP